MVYMIVDWDAEKLNYRIVTYSHNYDDMVNQFVRCKKIFPNCRIMIDLFAIQSEEVRLQYNLHRKEIKELLNVRSETVI